jgi:hypothetical protein
MGWLREGRHCWTQYVGRRVVRIVRGGSEVFLAFCGDEGRGAHATLRKAQSAAEWVRR